jgi:serine protease
MRMRTVLTPIVFAGAAAALAALALAPATAHARHLRAVDPEPDPVPPADVAFDDTLPTEIEGEIAIDLKDDATDADIQAFAGRYGIAVRPNSSWSTHDRFEVADVDPAQERALLDRMEHDPLVEHAEPMALYRAFFVPNDPLFESKQWHLSNVHAETGWDYTCGRGVTVAVIDTGVACFTKGPFSKGTDLEGTRCEGGYDFVNNGPEAADDHGHGTHVAGTIAQTTNNGMGTAGLAFCATLMPVKVLSKQGFGTVTNVAEGIRFAADNGAQIINMSLGGPTKSKIIEDAVKHAIAKGVLVVAAAGNSGRSVGYPAAYDGVLAVSATDSNDKIAWFSSRGPEVGIGAPGVNVTQQTICEGGKNKCEIFGTFNGTSMASPHVAGAAAMVLSMGVTDPAAIRTALEASARPKEEKNLYGAGILDVGPAVAHAHWLHVGLRLAALVALFGLIAARIKKGRGKLALNPLTIAGALVGAVGLLPVAPLLHLGSFGFARPAVELLMRPLGEWDLLFGAGLHRWLPLANALPAMAGVALLFGSRRLRPGVGGFAIGSAALLAQIALSADVSFGLGAFAMRLWMVANIAVCLWLGQMCLDKKNA